MEYKEHLLPHEPHIEDRDALVYNALNNNDMMLLYKKHLLPHEPHIEGSDALILRRCE
jgi:hypothetical protein